MLLLLPSLLCVATSAAHLKGSRNRATSAESKKLLKKISPPLEELPPASKQPVPKPISEPVTQPVAAPTRKQAIIQKKGDQPTAPPIFLPSGSSMSIQNKNAREKGSSSGPTIAGTLVGVVVAFTVLVLLLLFAQQRKSRKRKKAESRVEVLDTTKEEQKFDLTGDFKMVKNHNLDNFLDVTGVPWLIRSAAARARPMHSISHRGKLITMKFKGVPRATYIIDGRAVTNILQDRRFECTATYTEDDDGFEVHNKGLDDDFDIHLRWQLHEDKQHECEATVTLALTVQFRDEREPVTTIQEYKRVYSC